MRQLRAGTALVPGLVLCLLLAATGCGRDDRETTLELDEPAPSASATPSSVAPAAIPKDAPEGEFVRGLNPAQTPDEQAVAEVWFSYWAELQRMYDTAELDRSRFGALASGPASTSRPGTSTGCRRWGGTTTAGRSPRSRRSR